EQRIITSDLSGYSSETILESYFQNDKYSDEIKIKITEYEELAIKKDRTLDENIRFNELKKYFSHIPKYRAEELALKLQQIELNIVK
ncbi:MAG: hypothetical protein LBG77_00325, partial [Dysgonamonadaceae bacterium]|nr:hypothetical protein [Dysgonamonadaceae bacterium]